LPVGTRDPRMQRWVALTMAMLIRALTHPAADFRAGFLPLLGEHGGQFPQQDLGFIRRCHERRKVPTLLEAGPEVFLLFLMFVS
jgi:hypothetical protein